MFFWLFLSCPGVTSAQAAVVWTWTIQAAASDRQTEDPAATGATAEVRERKQLTFWPPVLKSHEEQGIIKELFAFF